MKRVVASLLCASLCLGGMAIARSAAAQPPDAEVQVQISEAKRHFETLDYEGTVPVADRAVQLLQTRQGEAAKRALAEVLEIRARAKFGMGDDNGAKQDFILMLKADPRHQLTGQVSQRAVDIFAEAKKATVTTLRLTMTPLDADVLLDGTRVSAKGEIFVQVGPHTIAASYRGYEGGTTEFTAAPETVAKMALSLKRSSAVLTVVTAPADVDVIVDGVTRGKTVGPLSADLMAKAAAAGISESTPAGVLTLAGLQIGTHRIELRGACLVPIERTLNVTQLGDYLLDPVKLASAMATLAASTADPNANVFVDGEARGAAPFTTQVCEGAHLVELRAPTGRYRQRIDAKVGQRYEVAGALRPAFAVVSSTQTTLNADLRGAIERALQPLNSILVFAPPNEALDPALKAEKLLPDWLGYDANRRPFGVSAEVTPTMRRDLSARLSKSFDAQGIAAVTAPVANNRSRLVVSLLAAGVAEPDVVEVNLEQPETVRAAVGQIDRELTFLRASIGANVADVVDVPGTVVASVDPKSPAALAGLQAGDVIVSANGKTVTDGGTFDAQVASVREGQALSLEVQDRSGNRKTIQTTAMLRPRLLGVSDETLFMNRALVMLRARLDSATNPAEQAAIRLNLAAALTHLESWTEARSELQKVTLSEGPGVGPGTVQYLLGLCNARLGNRADAEAAFKIAAASSSLLTDDGPPVKELAEARLAELQRGTVR